MTKRAPALLAALLLSPAAASAAPHGILWMPGRAPARIQSNASGAGLQYYGGPVIEHAKVYVVFWGAAADGGLKAQLAPFYANILDSGYMDWLKEYDTNRVAVDGRKGTNQHIGRGTYGGSFTIQPANTSSSLTDADVQHELDAQIAAGKLPPNDGNTLYMTYFPSGVSIDIPGAGGSCSAFCAYHEGFVSPRTGKPVYYGVMPSCGWGCGSETEVSSHECIEAVTDPFPTPGDSPAYPQAWNDAGGQEIADLCESTSGSVTGHGITSDVTGLWDDSIGGCNTGPWSQSPSAAVASVSAVPATRALPPIPMIGALRSIPAAGVFGR
jgi:hypothetical protein